MDQRLLATVPFAVHLIGGAMFAVAYSASDAAFVGSQLEFLAVTGYVVPVVAMGMIWLRNYVRGAPLLVVSAAMVGWFAVYFFYVHANPANTAAVIGDGARAYLSATIAVVLGLTCCAGSGTWLWYLESEGFRATVDGFVRPPESRE